MTRKHNQRAKAPVRRRAAKRTAKAPYRVRNWAAYNQSLVKRGSITLWQRRCAQCLAADEQRAASARRAKTVQ